MDADGNPQHPGDLAAQLELSVDNLEAVMAAADMTLANIVRLNFYARDVDELFKQFSRVNERFGDSRYATTVLGAGQLPARFLVMRCELECSLCLETAAPLDSCPAGSGPKGDWSSGRSRIAIPGRLEGPQQRD